MVLAVVSRDGGILGADGFDLVVSVIIALMFAAPYMVGQAFTITDRLLSFFMGRHSAAKLMVAHEKTDMPKRVMVVGLGPAGREVARHLKNAQLEPVVIDINPQSRVVARDMGIKLYLGDASSEEVLLHAHFQNVCMAVVTVPDSMTTIRIVETMRRLKSQLPIAARCRYNRYLGSIYRAGADIVIDEETHIGHDLAHQIVQLMKKGAGLGLACRMAGAIDTQAVSDKQPSATP